MKRSTKKDQANGEPIKWENSWAGQEEAKRKARGPQVGSIPIYTHLFTHSIPLITSK